MRIFSTFFKGSVNVVNLRTVAYIRVLRTEERKQSLNFCVESFSQTDCFRRSRRVKESLSSDAIVELFVLIFKHGASL